MNCKEFENCLPQFLDDKMNFMDVHSFVKHVSSCKDCREELTIQFLVREGMASLEEGDAFDLQGQLKLRLEKASKKVKFHRMLISAGCILEYLVMFGIIFTLFSIIFG